MNNKVIELALRGREGFYWNSFDKKKNQEKTAIIIFVLTVLLFSNSIIHMIVLCIQHGHVLPCQTNPVVVVLLCIYLVSLETICLFISYTSRVSDVVPLLFFMCRLLYAKPENRSKSPKTPECSVIVCLPVYIASYQKF